MLQLPAQLSKPLLIVQPAAEQLPFAFNYSHSMSPGSDGRAQVAAALKSVPEAEQGITIKLHGLDSTKKHGLPDDRKPCPNRTLQRL